ncbi:exonuclease 3'-5' domain-containing protein 1 [Microdochium nivale]|nr:exonuclease 3'-5' domain-containing protein 1 [Microdochium nivale]
MSAPGICFRRPCRQALRLRKPGPQTRTGLFPLSAMAWSSSISRDLATTNKRHCNKDIAKGQQRHLSNVSTQRSVASTSGKPSALEIVATAELISTPEALASFLAELTHPSNPPTSLYLDLEGYWLSRVGSLDILTILHHPQGTVHLIDVYTLQHLAFTTPSSSDPGLTLQAILEDPLTPKYLWDVRNDADALYAHYGVRLRCATDLQVLENATRGMTVNDRGHPFSRKLLWSLTTCIRRDLALSGDEMEAWAAAKDKMRVLMNLKATGPAAAVAATAVDQPVCLAGNLLTDNIPPVLLDATARLTPSNTADNSPGQEKGTTTTKKTSNPLAGLRPVLQPPAQIDLSESIFRRRPMSPATAAYCANDVVHLPALHAAYLLRLRQSAAQVRVQDDSDDVESLSPWHALVRRESDRRCEAVLMSSSSEGTGAAATAAGYDPFSADKVLAPWGKAVAALADAGLDEAGEQPGSSTGR